MGIEGDRFIVRGEGVEVLGAGRVRGVFIQGLLEVRGWGTHIGRGEGEGRKTRGL